MFIKNRSIWVFLPVFHILLNPSKSYPIKNKRTHSYNENNGKGTAVHNNECEKQCYHRGRVTHKADRKRCIPIDNFRPPPPHSRITLSSICIAVQHESWPHPLRCQSCQEDTPTHGSHGCTCGLQENDHLFILQWTNSSILLIILILIEILTDKL